MREKLQLLMNSENLTGSKLAEYLGIQPSSISHILGGRNKPSLDFVQKILQRYPRINPDWLLLDSEQMYRSEVVPPTMPSSELQFDAPSPANSSTPAEATTGSIPNSSTTAASQTFNSPVSAMDAVASFVAPQNRGVKRIIVMFDDHTFESYEPRR